MFTLFCVLLLCAQRGLEAVGGASPLPPAEVVNAPTDSDTESNHRIVHQSIGSEGSGALKIALDDSSDDDSLQLHSGPFWFTSW